MGFQESTPAVEKNELRSNHLGPFGAAKAVPARSVSAGVQVIILPELGNIPHWSAGRIICFALQAASGFCKCCLQTLLGKHKGFLAQETPLTSQRGHWELCPLAMTGSGRGRSREERKNHMEMPHAFHCFLSNVAHCYGCPTVGTLDGNSSPPPSTWHISRVKNPNSNLSR